MTDNNLLDSPEKDKSLSTEKDKVNSSEEKPFFAKGIFSYKDKGTQGVINLFGYELTAPAGLKNPGIVYLSFIFVNLLIFLILKSFIAG
ncbi:hypothetical protein [Prochlorococcus marinus]|jgi:hypothetical protein|uniref:hypothetical protein n=1 Tax=Prochlorococcus marinus TaxID=1219 RepID=UPI0022B3B1EA|nr:hypothetical protein [Prochlorococcus marinus]